MSEFVVLEKSQGGIFLGPPLKGARGGQGVVHEVVGLPDLVAKVFHRRDAREQNRLLEYSAKLLAMIANPPADPMAGTGHVSIAWPVDRLLSADSTRQCLGYVMPRIHGALRLHDYSQPKSRLRKCPLFNYRYLLRTARNLAAAVRAVHQCGYVIGDLSEANILVTNQALVTLVDTDSFQVPDGPHLYRCLVGRDEIAAPEHMRELHKGLKYGQLDRRPEQDNYALAVLVFRILMQGVHPYHGIFTGRGQAPALKYRVLAGHWPHHRSRVAPYTPPPLAPPFASLPPSVQELTRRCFEDGHRHPERRPDAARWLQVLDEAERDLDACSVNPQHLFPHGLSSCPWCELGAQLGIDLFPNLAENAPVVDSDFGLAEDAGTAAPDITGSHNSRSYVPLSTPPPTSPWPMFLKALALTALVVLTLVVGVFCAARPRPTGGKKAEAAPRAVR